MAEKWIDSNRLEDILRSASSPFSALPTQMATPMHFFDMAIDEETMKVVLTPVEELRKWLLSVSSSLMAGSTYKPTVPLNESSAWINWTKQHPELYALAMQISPAFKAADFQMHMSQKANQYPNEVIPGDKVLTDAQDVISEQPSIVDAVRGVPKVAGDVVNFSGDILSQVIKTLLEILKVLNDVVVPAVREMWAIMKENMRPAADFLNQEIFEPYKKIAADGKVAFEQYRNMVEQQDMSVDAAVPPIVMPNIQEYAKLLPVLAKYFNLPIVGSIAKAELQAMDMVDYQATQMRGFGSPLKMLDYAAGMSAPAGVGQALTDLATKPPAWFLSNI